MKHAVDEERLGYLVKSVLSGGCSKATAYISETLVAKAKRKMFGGKVRANDRIAEISVTVGAPNYAERKYIKGLHKAVEFPFYRLKLR